MSRRTASGPGNGFADVIGVALLAVALLLLVAQWSFDRHDISWLGDPHNQSTHNWIMLPGAYLAFGSFFLLGIAAYLLPFVFAAFGTACLLNFPGYLRERSRWSVLWAVILLISLTGLLYLADNGGLRGKLHETIGAQSIGGLLGCATYGEIHHPNYTLQYGFSLLGPIGATIVYGALGLISLLFLTDFRLGDWIRRLFAERETAAVGSHPNEESTLDRRARELEKQARQLQEQVARSGLGADLQPVPEPTVRDLSVPQSKGPRIRKTTLPEPPKEPARDAADVDEKPSPRDVPAATTEDILGRKAEAEKPVEAKAETPLAETGKAEPEKSAAEKPDEAKAEPVIHIADGSVRKPRALKKPKPLTVASTPIIGNYQLPPMDFLQHADMTAKPTESKEELMANARLMQQTLAQFDIEVSLGDITKGPTITRYELHPAPGVKLEKITALSNNIAAALKAERIHILAPVPGKSSVGVEVPIDAA